MVQDLLGQLWFHFLLVGVFGFLTGLEFREYLNSKEHGIAFGTVRTYTFVALLGFVLSHLDPGFRLYLGGMAGLILWLGIFYHHKLDTGQTGVLGMLIPLLVYTFGPAVQVLPLWFLVLLFVSIVFVLNTRPLTYRLSRAMDSHEVMTLAKFLLMAAVILPLMPDRQVVPFLPTTPFKIWVAVVAVSAISYVGYLLQRYVFPGQGYLVSGIFGGLYSSTATTVVLARKTRTDPAIAPRVNPGIVAASGMMYLRLLLLVAILNPAFLTVTLWPFTLLGAGSVLASVAAARRRHSADIDREQAATQNPLELGTAVLFALLFMVMLLVSGSVIHRFGSPGLNVLSGVVGFTDIDPFVLSLLKGDFASVSVDQLAPALVIAAGSNNFLKALYVVSLGRWRENRSAALALIGLGVLTLAYGLLLVA